MHENEHCISIHQHLSSHKEAEIVLSFHHSNFSVCSEDLESKEDSGSRLLNCQIKVIPIEIFMDSIKPEGNETSKVDTHNYSEYHRQDYSCVFVSPNIL